VEDALYAAAPDLEGLSIEDPAAPAPPLITLARRVTHPV
jgi:hypothetical protein